MSIFWVAGGIAGALSLVVYRFTDRMIRGDRYWGHNYWPSYTEQALHLYLDLFVSVLLVGILYLVAGTAATKLGVLPGVRLKRSLTVAGGISLFSLHSFPMIGTYLLGKRFGLDADFSAELAMPLEIVLELAAGIVVFLPRFVFLGYGLRLSTGIVPRFDWRVISMGLVAYISLALLFMVTWGNTAVALGALDLDPVGELFDFLRDQWRASSSVAKLAAMDGAGLSFLLWYWIVFPKGFRDRSGLSPSSPAATALQ